MNSTLNLALKKVARNLSVDQKLVEQVYKSYWLFIKESINSVSLKDLKEEEFESNICNINLPYLGKLYVDHKKLAKYHRKINLYKDVKTEENKADRMSGSSD